LTGSAYVGTILGGFFYPAYFRMFDLGRRATCEMAIGPQAGLTPGSETWPGTAENLEGEGTVIEWFDDLTLGMRFKSREKLVTREEIKRFASEFDPQPYHLDEAAAEKTPLKGLAASGWHTAAIAMWLTVEVRPFGPHPLLGIGVDELRWLAPVRPGDRLYLEGEVIELTRSKKKPQGVVRIKWTAFNQRGEPVYTFTPIAVVPCRPN
jgi:acyl dehydratase